MSFAGKDEEMKRITGLSSPPLCMPLRPEMVTLWDKVRNRQQSFGQDQHGARDQEWTIVNPSFSDRGVC